MNSSLLKGDLLGLKEKLLSIEKEFENKQTEVEVTKAKFKNINEQLDDYLDTKDTLVTLNIGGKKFLTKVSTLMSLKDTLFCNMINSFLSKGEECPKEFFVDRNYSHFKMILDYLRTKQINLKSLNKYDKIEVLQELEYYGLTNSLNLSKKETYEIGWDPLSKAGQCTINPNDSKNLKVHSTGCYTSFVTDRLFTDENFMIELESTVTQTDNYYYIGIVNESYSLTGSCMCCNPANSYYIQCDGTAHINSTNTPVSNMAWRSESVTIGMRVYLSRREIYFYISGKGECGPYQIAVGSSFRVVAGHCNTGNGEITITECCAIDP